MCVRARACIYRRKTIFFFLPLLRIAPAAAAEKDIPCSGKKKIVPLARARKRILLLLANDYTNSNNIRKKVKKKKKEFL